MKKLLVFILSALVFSSNTFANDDIKVYNNYIEIELTNKPVKVEGVTMLPVREICEALGHTVNWLSEEKMIKITENPDNELYPIAEQNEINIYNTLNTNKCHFDIYSKTGNYYRECFDFEISSPSMQINGTTYLPKDFFIYMLDDNIEETEGIIYFIPNIIKTDFSQYNKACLFIHNNRVDITDSNDIELLKSILTSRAINGASSNEYSKDYYIQFENTLTNEKEIVLLSKKDNNTYSSYVQLNTNSYYIEINNKENIIMLEIINKYVQ